MVVGGLAFVLDVSTLRCGLGLGLHYLAAAGLGFLLGLLTNFILCVLWVWRGTQAKAAEDFLVFTIIGVAGLGLTELGMWAGVSQMKFSPMATKIGVAGLVLLWNFSLRKLLVFSN